VTTKTSWNSIQELLVLDNTNLGFKPTTNEAYISFENLTVNRNRVLEMFLENLACVQ